MCKKTIAPVRMNALVVGTSLDETAKRHGYMTTEEIARPVQIVLRRNSIYGKKDVPYATLLKNTSGNNITIQFMKSGKKEVISRGEIFPETPLGENIEIDGVTYQKETLNGYPRYVPSKKQN